jgi:hypothetical protein
MVYSWNDKKVPNYAAFPGVRCINCHITIVLHYFRPLTLRSTFSSPWMLHGVDAARQLSRNLAEQYR